MEPASPIAATALPRPRSLSPALLILAVCAIIFLRAPFLDDDVLKSDEAVYAVTARAWAHGLLPGRDLWDNKPPGMPALYLLGSALTGHMIYGSRVLALALSIVILLVTLRLAVLLSPGLPWWPVALAYLLITHANGWPASEWVVLNGELPAAALVGLSALCLAEWSHRDLPDGPARRRWPLLAAAGCFAGLAIQFRQTAVLPVVGLVVWLGWSAFYRRRRIAAWPVLLAGGAGMALAWLPVTWTYWSRGALPYLWTACLGHGLAYAAEAPARAWGWTNLNAALGAGLLPELLQMAGIGVMFALARLWRLRTTESGTALPIPLLLTAFGLGSLAAVLPSGHLFGHYFLQMASVWALVAGLGVARLRRFATVSPVPAAAAVLLLVGVVAMAARVWASQPGGPVIACLWLEACLATWLVGIQLQPRMVPLALLALMPLPLLGLAMGQSPATYRATERFRQANRALYGDVVAEIDRRTGPSDRILVWGWAPQVYWYSDRLPACRDVTLNYALGWIGEPPHELFAGARAALLTDLRRRPPAVVAVPNDLALPYAASPGWRPEAAPEVWAFIRAHYRLANHMPHWDLYVPRAPQLP